MKTIAPTSRHIADPIEVLESRIAPASVVSIMKTDVDGDFVEIKISGPGNFTASDVNITQDMAGNITKIDLTNPQFNHADVTVKASPDKTGPQVKGDGYVNVGQIDATGNDLGHVTVRGDLKSINAGDGNTADGAIKEINVQSMGDSTVAGTTT